MKKINNEKKEEERSKMSVWDWSFCDDMRKERERECCRVLPIDDRTKHYNLRMWTIRAINVDLKQKQERKKKRINENTSWMKSYLACHSVICSPSPICFLEFSIYFDLVTNKIKQKDKKVGKDIP